MTGFAAHLPANRGAADESLAELRRMNATQEAIQGLLVQILTRLERLDSYFGPLVGAVVKSGDWRSVEKFLTRDMVLERLDTMIENYRGPSDG